MEDRTRRLFLEMKPFILGLIDSAGGGAGPFAPSPHDLAGAHHTGTLDETQYPDALLRDGSRSLLGNWSVAAGVTIDGVDVSQLKSDYDAHDAASARLAHGSLGTALTAGAGLAGTGTLEGGAMTLDIGAGDGITVDTDSIQVKLSSPANPGMFFDSGGLRIGAGTGITVNPASVEINQGFSPTWTGLHTFNRSGAPFAIGASSADQLVDGLNADLLDGLEASAFALSSITIIAGSGLTGGGALTANVTLNVGAGDGITVNADDVALTTPGTLTAATANTAAGSHTHAITASDNPGAAVSLLKSSAAGRLTLAELAATRVGSDLIPLTTDTYDLGSSLLLWRKGWLSELDAVLFAQQTITLLGGWFIVGKNEGAAAADVGSGDTAVDFGQAMTNGHFVIFRSSLAVEYMQVGTLVSGTTYNVTRNLDGSGANAWPSGSVYLVLGTTGDGRIELNAYDTPRISIVRQGATYNAQTEIIRIGDLVGNWGYPGQEYGIAIGEYASGIPNLTWDDTEGLRIRTYNGAPVIQLDISGNALISNKLKMEGASSAITIGATPPTSATVGTGIWLDRTGLYGLAASVQQVVISATTGQITAGAGDVVLDAEGLHLENASAIRSSHAIYWNNGATERGFLGLSDQPTGTPDSLRLAASDSLALMLEGAGGVIVPSGLVTYVPGTNKPTYIPADGNLGVEEVAAVGLDLVVGSHDTTLTPGRGGLAFFVEATGNPGGELTAGNVMAIYMKSDKIVIAYNHGGTVKYRYLDLTSTNATWVYTTTAP